MELRQLRYFVAVAEELQFSRAAERLRVGQSTVSEQIQRLELSLGTRLLVRTSRSVLLTPAGTVALARARRILADVDLLKADVGLMARGRSGRLRLGSVGPALSRVVPTVVRAIRASAPDIEITVELLSTSEQLTALRTGRLDAGFVRAVEPDGDVNVEDILVEPLLAVLPSDHVLATRDAIPLRALSGEPFVFPPREANSRLFDMVLALCHHHGCVPGQLIEAASSETQLALVGAGLGVSVQAASFREEGRTDVAFVPLADGNARVALQIAWPGSADNPAVAVLLTAARDVGRDLGA